MLQQKYEDGRISNLITHGQKILLYMVHSGIDRELKENINETQFGFRNTLGIQEPSFQYKVL